MHTSTNNHPKIHNQLIIVVFILTIVNIINCLTLRIELFPLIENQILYIYSSLAQIVGALLGLTIAGYSIIDSKMKNLALNDTTISAYVEDIRDDYYKSLIHIIGLSSATIFLCLIVLAVYKGNFTNLSPFFMTETMLIFVFAMIEVIEFVRYLNPNAISEKSSNDKKTIDSEYKTDSTNSSETFSPFITYYNLLEKLLKDFAHKLTNSTSPPYNIRYTEALDILLYNKIISKESYSMINEFRYYRNALVHSLNSDKSVNPLIYNNLEKTYTLLKELYNTYLKNGEISQEQQNNLLTYSSQSGYSETDKRILEYLANHPLATTRDISEHLNYTNASVHRRLLNLQNLGIIQKIHKGKYVLWKSSDNS